MRLHTKLVHTRWSTDHCSLSFYISKAIFQQNLVKHCFQALCSIWVKRYQNFTTVLKKIEIMRIHGIVCQILRIIPEISFASRLKKANPSEARLRRPAMLRSRLAPGWPHRSLGNASGAALRVSAALPSCLLRCSRRMQGVRVAARSFVGERAENHTIGHR